MRGFMGVFRQGLVVEIARGFWVEGEVELIFPAEFEPRARQRIVADLRGRVAFGEVGGMGRELIGNHADFDIFAVREAQMLFRRDICLLYTSPSPRD